MGQILSQPVTEKHSEEGKDKYLAFGLSCMQGWRINMEDAHSTILNLSALPKSSTSSPKPESEEKQEQEEQQEKDNNDSSPQIAFFGVYDGHGGEKAAIFSGEHLHKIIQDTDAFKKGDYSEALKQGFLACDQAILHDFQMRDDESGCAATSAIITPEMIICGNAGDSRTIMSINGFAKALSYDHKPSNEGEKARICAAGGYVDMGRVNGNLALSRGIGDFDFKRNVDLPAEEQIVTCYPDVIQHKINLEQDEFIVLACDGIWDCLSSQKCVECVRRGIYERKSLITISEEIMELCCAPTSDGSGIGCDNMSIVIIALLDYQKEETLEQWYDKIISRIDAVEQDKSLVDKYGSISPPYNDLYKEMYGEFYNIGQQADNVGGGSGRGGALAGMANGNSIFGRGGYDEDDKDEEEIVGGGASGNAGSTAATDLNTGAISLQRLLASSAITNENGVIYLDTSSAQSLFAHFGVAEPEQDLEEDVEDVHERHTEEEDIEEDEEEEHQPQQPDKIEEIKSDDE
ncbi:Protein phosphatase 2C 2 [Spathaspora sp. JA1]|nr:Protein phosphatase 2C 2 [Spathaspora sp. JA1]